LALAQHQREGLLSDRIRDAKEGIFQALALIEAYLDFPEDDIEHADSSQINEYVSDSLEKIDALVDGVNEGRVLREGVSVLIAGKPNVGKSSLLNNLLREKRAIVTSVPGTTRDIIEEVINIKGLPVKMLDTAGIRKTDDIVEQEGVRLALERIGMADLVLVVLDISRPFDGEDRLLVESIDGRNIIVVKNKSDLSPVINIPDILKDKPNVEISTVKGTGIEILRDMIFSTFVHNKAVDSREYVVMSQSRHRDALVKTKNALGHFKNNYEAGMNLEILALDLRDALNAIGEITGETTPDDILDLIFQRFCIGK
jgi:tRNA modification GTPase